jgi:carboxylesterase
MVFSASELKSDISIVAKTSGDLPKTQEVAKGHVPYTIGSGHRACLLVHGIAGSPAQMRLLAEFLAHSGFTARGILLPGHGTHPDDLEGIVWQDWYEHVHDEYNELRRDHDEVNLIGFSIGAALAAHYAAHNAVDRLVLLSLPLCPLNDRFPTNLMLRIYWTFFKTVKGSPEIVHNSEGEPFCFVYDRVPTAVLHTMSELIGIIKDRLHRISSPTLIIQSRNDRVSGAKSGPLAYRRISSFCKRLVMLEKSGHNVMIDKERERVFEEIIGFFSSPLMSSGTVQAYSPLTEEACQV